MTMCGQGDEESATEESGVPPVRDQHAYKSTRKLVRVLTVMAYLLSVSLAAILLSVYYICVWKSPELPLVNASGTALPMAQQSAVNDKRSMMQFYPSLVDTGRSNSSINKETKKIKENTTIDTVETIVQSTTNGDFLSNIDTNSTQFDFNTTSFDVSPTTHGNVT